MSGVFAFDLTAALDRIADRRRGGGAGSSEVAPSRSETSQKSRANAAASGHVDSQSFHRECSSEPSMSQKSQVAAPASAGGYANQPSLSHSSSSEPSVSQKSRMSQVAQPNMAMRRDLTDDERERFAERAAIVEFDGGLTRREAERFALAGILAAR